MTNEKPVTDSRTYTTSIRHSLTILLQDTNSMLRLLEVDPNGGNCGRQHHIDITVTVQTL